MTEKLIWKCDGCDDEREMKGNGNGDWKLVDVSLGGFQGYPTSAPKPVMEHRFHLCPDCARRYYEAADPRRWTRYLAQATAAV